MMTTTMPETPTQTRGRRDFVQFQSTPDGDVRTVIVEPSFDSEDASAKGQPVQLPKLSDDTAANERLERRHSSHLSAHFFDATTLSDESAAGKDSQGSNENGPTPTSSKSTSHITPASSVDDRFPSTSNQTPAKPSAPTIPIQQAAPSSSSSHVQHPEVNVSPSKYENERARGNAPRYPPPQLSPHVGQKHRRVFSGGGTNPTVAHRRINSGGNTAVVDRPQDGRGSYRSSFRQSPTAFRLSPTAEHHRGGGHRRENSAGLDMLSAAANVSKDVLAEAAGAKPPPSSSGRRVDRFNLSPTSFSSIGSASPSQYYGRSNNWSNGPTPPPPPSMKNEASNHPAQQSSSQYRYPEPDRHHRQQQYYPPPPPSYYPAPRGSGPSGSYPLQYAPGYHPVHPGSRKHLPPPGAPSMSQHPPPPPSRHDSRGSVGSLGKIETEGGPYAGKESMPPPPAGWNKERGGTTTGVQTFVTAISVGDGNRTMQPSATQQRNVSTSTNPAAVGSMPPSSAPEQGGHHRKMSSFSSLGAFLGNGVLFPEDENAGPAQHHGQSPSVSFYEEGMEGLDTADKLLQQLSAPLPSHQGSRPRSKSPVPGPTPSPRQPQAPVPSVVTSHSSSTPNSRPRGYMTAGTSKRIRRKCTVADCTNRVVQGGLCIAHGAKRKQCAHPGCTKNVKKAGLCSTHGPARKRCDHEGCTKVAVQGGKCISHGAKKKLCSVETCTKQAILAGMCKKHHDQHKGVSSSRGGGRRNSNSSGAEEASKPGRKAPAPQYCVPVGGQPKVAPEHEQPRSTPGHQRGLSIFTDMSAVDSIIGSDGGSLVPSESAPPGGNGSLNSEERGEVARVGASQSFGSEVRVESSPPQGERPKNGHHQRGLSIFTDESMAETIIQMNPQNL